jgi:hypothetical protein
LILAFKEKTGNAKDLTCGDNRRIAGEHVAALRPASSVENTFAHETLQYGLQISRRQTMARRQHIGGKRLGTCGESDVNYRGKGKSAFARQEWHDRLAVVN